LLTKNYDDDMMADILMMEESSLRPMGEFIYENINFTTTHYISADRIGPQDYYPKQSFAEFPNVGRQGEYTANMLSKKRNDTVYEALCLETGATHTVLDQTEAWLEKIFDGGKIDVRPIDEANLVVMEMNSERTQHLYKPTNIGFGYSYALPIIVSGLIAQKGERLIIENPEAHLHPYAQSQITKFLAKVSACGVQIFIESHSEHILNALRIAVLDKIITTEDLNILYFDRNETNQVTKIPVQEDGAIEEWPVGFFDQTDKDFERLFGF
jgi:predicted ATPase